MKKATDETNDEKKLRYAVEDELRKLDYGSPLPEDYKWERNGSLRNPYNRIINGDRSRSKKRKDPTNMKEMIEFYSGTGIKTLHMKLAKIAHGTNKKATQLQFNAIKYLMELYHNEELKTKQVNHNVEISLSDQLLQLAEKTKEQKLLNEKNIIDVEIED